MTVSANQNSVLPELAGELRRLYPSSGRGRPKGRPNTISVRAAVYARQLRADGLVGQRLGEAVAELVGRGRPYGSEELAACERALREAEERGLRVGVPRVAALGAKRARQAQAALDRYSRLSASSSGGTDQRLLGMLDAYARFVRATDRPELALIFEGAASDLRVRLDQRAERLADEAFERGREQRQRRIEQWGPRFKVTVQNTLREHHTDTGRVVYQSLTLEPSDREQWAWERRRALWQLAVIGETLGREAHDQFAQHLRSERKWENRRRLTLSLDYESSSSTGRVSTRYDLGTGREDR